LPLIFLLTFVEAFNISMRSMNFHQYLHNAVPAWCMYEPFCVYDIHSTS